MTRPTSTSIRILFLLLAVGLPLRAQTEEKRELFPNGDPQKIYHVDEDGELHGSYVEFFSSGKLKMRARYVHGVPDGKYEVSREAGGRVTERFYKDGRVRSLKRYDEDDRVIYELKEGRQGLALITPEMKDVLLFPRSPKEIARGLAKIDVDAKIERADWFKREPSLSDPYDAGELNPAFIEDGIRHLNGYRYLAGLPHALGLDRNYQKLAQHAALVCCLNGDISHTPKKPEGLPDDLFALGNKGAADSNLHQGQSSLRQAIDGFMDDSDETNIDRVGHRRWFLSPSMKRTGLGMVGGFVAAHVQDYGERATPPLTVAYPSPGFYPISYLAGPHVAWHFSWDGGRVRVDSGKEVEVKLTLLDESYDFVAPLEAERVSRDSGRGGDLPCIIFRPKLTAEQFKPGLRVLVEIKNLLLPKKQLPTYIVELVDLKSID